MVNPRENISPCLIIQTAFKKLALKVFAVVPCFQLVCCGQSASCLLYQTYYLEHKEHKQQSIVLVTWHTNCLGWNAIALFTIELSPALEGYKYKNWPKKSSFFLQSLVCTISLLQPSWVTWPTTLKFNTRTLRIAEIERAGKISRIATFEVCSIRI